MFCSCIYANNTIDNLGQYADHSTSISPGGLTDWGLGDWIPVKSVAAKEPQTLSAGKYAFSINM